MKLVVALVLALSAGCSAFSGVPAPGAASSALAPRMAASTASATVMRCRTNTKREKFFRNLENAKRFRKSSFKPYNRNVRKAADDEDTAVLSSIYVATDSSGEPISGAEEEAAAPVEA